jgi:hypothetical protein
MMGSDIDVGTGACEFTFQHGCGKALGNAALRFTFALSLDLIARLDAILRRIDALISDLLMPSSPSRLPNANGSEIVAPIKFPRSPEADRSIFLVVCGLLE